MDVRAIKSLMILIIAVWVLDEVANKEHFGIQLESKLQWNCKILQRNPKLQLFKEKIEDSGFW